MNARVPVLDGTAEIKEWLIKRYGLHLSLATKMSLKIAVEVFEGAFRFDLRIIFIVLLCLISEVFNAHALFCLPSPKKLRKSPISGQQQQHFLGTEYITLSTLP